MLRIIEAVVMDGAVLVGRTAGALLAGVEESILAAHTRRGVLDMSVAELNAKAEDGTLTYREIKQATNIAKAAERVCK